MRRAVAMIALCQIRSEPVRTLRYECSVRSFAACVAAAALCLLSIPSTVTPAAASGQVVAFNAEASPGTIVVRTNERRLYLAKAARCRIRSASAGPDASGPAAR
jgi:hypothetical protein